MFAGTSLLVQGLLSVIQTLKRPSPPHLSGTTDSAREADGLTPKSRGLPAGPESSPHLALLSFHTPLHSISKSGNPPQVLVLGEGYLTLSGFLHKLYHQEPRVQCTFSGYLLLTHPFTCINSRNPPNNPRGQIPFLCPFYRERSYQGSERLSDWSQATVPGARWWGWDVKPGCLAPEHGL